MIRVANVAREIARVSADPGRSLDSENEREGHTDEQDLEPASTFGPAEPIRTGGSSLAVLVM